MAHYTFNSGKRQVVTSISCPICHRRRALSAKELRLLEPPDIFCGASHLAQWVRQAKDAAQGAGVPLEKPLWKADRRHVESGMLSTDLAAVLQGIFWTNDAGDLL